jgi:acetyl esterase
MSTDIMPLPYLDAFSLEAVKELAKGPPADDLNVQEFRDEFEALQEEDNVPNPNVTRSSFVVPFEDGVETFVFKAKGAEGILPVIFYFHGGGWISGTYGNLPGLETETPYRC